MKVPIAGTEYTDKSTGLSRVVISIELITQVGYVVIWKRPDSSSLRITHLLAWDAWMNKKDEVSP